MEKTSLLNLSSFLLLSLLLGGCFSTKAKITIPLSERHQPSGLHQRFEPPPASFQDYEKQSMQRIADARTDLLGANQAAIIAGNAPFDLVPPEKCAPGKSHRYRRGILLSHGLTDSPYFMKALGRFFQSRCFRVMALLLPGHGTRPGDLLEVDRREWIRAERFGVQALVSEADAVYLAGFSTGGTLSIGHALDDKRIRGLFLFSPALRVSALAVMANWHKVISWAFPRAKWIDILGDSDPFKYESFPANAADQIHLLTKELRAKLSKQPLNIPLFIAASEDDATVSTEESLRFFRASRHSQKRMVLYSRADAPPKKGLQRIKNVFPEKHIISSAHTAMTLPPDDPHYGEQGDYAYCSHYFPQDAEKYRRCKKRQEDFLGEISAENLKKGVLRRLMFNPNYAALTKSLDDFITALP